MLDDAEPTFSDDTADWVVGESRHQPPFPFAELERLQKIISRDRPSRRLQKEMEGIFAALNAMLDSGADQTNRDGLGVSCWDWQMKSRFACIYRINTPAMPCLYVGSTTDFGQRANQHRDKLKYACRIATMMHAIDLPMPKVEIKVVEVCHRAVRLPREQFWINQLWPVANRRRACAGLL